MSGEIHFQKDISVKEREGSLSCSECGSNDISAEYVKWQKTTYYRCKDCGHNWSVRLK